MKKIILLLFLFNNVTAQNANSVWIFGDSAGINFSGGATPITSVMDGRGSCLSVSDSLGNLILYAFTVSSSGAWSTHIYNSALSSIQGADSITGEGWYNELALFPKPGSDSLYYLFSVGLEPNINQGLFLTTIDMSQNSGLGAVVQQNVQINPDVLGDCITAVKHGNGRDWWVVTKYHPFPFTFFNRFYVYNVSNTSITLVHTIDFNDASDVAFQKIIVNPSGNKFMLINVRGYMAEFNFDRCTGNITFDKLIFPEINNLSRAFWEGAYSPNGNLFYVSRNSYGAAVDSFNYLLQYDLTSTNVPASCDTLDVTAYPPADCGAVRLAPDGKIYYTQAYPYGIHYTDTMRNIVNENLGVVNNPDITGIGCNFQPFSFYLGGKRTYYGLPNNPDYSLGALVGSSCDTLTVISEINGNEKSLLLHLSPNPVTRTLYFNAERINGKLAKLQILNALGEIVYERTVEVFNGGYVTQRIDVSNYGNGVYVVMLQTEKGITSGKFVKQ